ncbi:hypothetical protein [Legionella oakridgensis]|uniref:Uncharacterized protein n=2 Tax=Legionella oakridgensis TaxID=29423 RepID=W0B6M5_9GAMM|nr:hypothetical protein [Legionella oakridgensis]AHE66198.1 hypothetical protein Loa_00629 [Legionella oakridgensis ATCC 33761 = DSM 21215]ETO93990.1 hypothetical protein LOR_6c00190 [Legionella oakridgensis RV-2-2007]KTD42333.1 hypothetical protein Loak_0759 [Legionella oakridgensis]STY16105.1 Uncharacterised protein [Legionella longbeachae]
MKVKANNVISYVGNLVNKIEPKYTLRLEDIIYSKSHGHEICVMQLVGKNAFPKYTPEELLSDPNAMVGLSPQDAVTITRLEYIIKERKKNLRVLEIDRNGTILLRDSSGREYRYSEKYISSSREMIKKLKSEDAHDLGYRVGFREGLDAKKYKKQLSGNIRSKFMKFIPFRQKEAEHLQVNSSFK